MSQRLQFRGRAVHVAVLEQRNEGHYAVIHEVLDAGLDQVVLDVGQHGYTRYVVKAVDVPGDLLRCQVPLLRWEAFYENGYLMVGDWWGIPTYFDDLQVGGSGTCYSQGAFS